MEFKVIRTVEDAGLSFHGEAWYEFNEAGLLVTHSEGGLRTIWSPSAWLRVEDRPAPPLSPISEGRGPEPIGQF